MSAYTMGPDDLAAMAAFVHYGLDKGSPKMLQANRMADDTALPVPSLFEVAQRLCMANCESVAYRYQRSKMTFDDAAEMAGVSTFEELVRETYGLAKHYPTDDWAYGALEEWFGSFQYQSCEPPCWPGSQVARLTTAAREICADLNKRGM